MVEDADGFITSFTGLWYLSQSVAFFRDIRNLLFESFDDDGISEDEFLLLYVPNPSKNPDFPYDCYNCSTSLRWTAASVWQSFVFFFFYENDVPVLLEALQLPQSFTCHHGTICDGIEQLCMADLLSHADTAI